MLHSNAPVLPHKNAVFLPIQDLGKAKPFMGHYLKTNDFAKHKLVDVQGQHYVVLPWTMHALRHLALHDIFVPGPIRWDYTWPSKYPRPLDHQVVTADFLTQNPRAFVLNSIGTNKTLSALWAADYLMRKGEIRKVLISAPLSTLERVWENEIFCNLFGRQFATITGDAKRRQRQLERHVDFYIINHDGMKVIEDELMAKEDIDLVILDEGALFRNQKTQLWRTCYNVAGVQTDRWLWWMTGGPMPREPTDIWAQAKIVRPDTVPKYFSQFRNRTMFQLSEYKWVPVKDWERVVFDAVRPVIRYTREETQDLPPEYTEEVECKMSKKQAQAYESMSKSLVVEASEGVITAANEGVKLNKLLQIACGALYTKEKGETVPLDPEPKFKQLDEWVEFSGNKVLVFAPFKYCLPMIASRYEKKGLKVAQVSGDTSKNERNKLFKNFQEGDLEVLVAHPKCMAHGLTLTRSNVICWWAPVDDYEIYDQACGRIKRTGQSKPQYVVHLVGSAVETEVFRRLARKEKMQGVVLKLFKEEKAA